MKKIQSFTLLLVFLAGFSLSSCGGGTKGSTVPSAPANLAATGGDGQVTLTWDAVDGAGSYTIYWKNAAGVTKSDSSITGAVSPYNHTGLTSGTTYYYAVTAVEDTLESELSSEVSASTYSLLKAFVTSVFGNGNLGSWANASGQTGLAAGDAICQSLAEAAGLAGTFKAWLSDSTNDAYCRIHNLTGKKAANCGQDALPDFAGPWMRTDGNPFAGKISRIFSTTYEVYMPIRYDEEGNDLGYNADYFTGTMDGGVLNNLNNACNDWTSTAVVDTMTGGRTGGTAESWTDHWSDFCNSPDLFRLLCLQTGPGASLTLPENTGKKAFVTSVQGTGNFSGWAQAGGQTKLDAGDAICQTLAANAGLSGTFKALISGDTVDARDRITSDGPWVRLDKFLVAQSKADLFDGSLIAPINLTETSAYVTSDAWTGSNADGTTYLKTCSDWSDGTAGPDGRYGNSYLAYSSWISVASMPCSSENSLYCLED